jgi:phenylalanyl-tRNA synthetase alpha chain
MSRSPEIDPLARVAAVDWEAYERQALDAVTGAPARDELEEARVHAVGRKSDLALALREVRDRENGMLLNGVRQRIEAAVEERRDALERAELEQRLAGETIDVTLPGEELPLGQLHPITQTRRAIEDAFLGLGYHVRYDPEVETTEYNFDKLAFDPWHPARSHRATFFLDDATVLRTETSPSQIHELEQHEPPLYMVSIGRCYRRDAIDATHYPIFHQFEGLAVDEGLTLADLKGTLLHVMRQLFGEERRVRFRTHYFPFTEPSIEPDVSCGICGGSGCKTCKYSGWLEMGGAGMVDPRVFENVGVDPTRWSGFAFGCGIERVAQLRHDIGDIRALWEGDLRVLRQF